MIRQPKKDSEALAGIMKARYPPDYLKREALALNSAALEDFFGRNRSVALDTNPLICWLEGIPSILKSPIVSSS